MIDSDDICKMSRTSHTDKHIIGIISIVHSLTKEQVRNILIDRGLMTLGGNYNAPIRLTGKEKAMAKQWRWTDERKGIYANMTSEGRTPDEIAKRLGCDEKKVRRYANELLRAPSPVTTLSAIPDVPKAIENEQPAPSRSPLLHTLVRDARELCESIWADFETQDHLDTYGLGRLQEKLALAEQLLDA